MTFDRSATQAIDDGSSGKGKSTSLHHVDVLDFRGHQSHATMVAARAPPTMRTGARREPTVIGTMAMAALGIAWRHPPVPQLARQPSQRLNDPGCLFWEPSTPGWKSRHTLRRVERPSLPCFVRFIWNDSLVGQPFIISVSAGICFRSYNCGQTVIAVRVR